MSVTDPYVGANEHLDVVWQVGLTCRWRWRSSGIRTLVRGRTRCRSGTGRTRAAGRERGWPAAPVPSLGCTWRPGASCPRPDHYPRQNYRREGEREGQSRGLYALFVKCSYRQLKAIHNHLRPS